MAIEKLPADFQDDVINQSVNEKRQYQMIENPNGTVSLEDTTVYEKIGSYFGAEQINQTNGAVNELIETMDKVEKEASKTFDLRNQAVLTFVNKICSISDKRITPDSLADVYFTSDTKLNAEKAVIDVETYAGRVDLTAEREPEGEIKASIVIRVV